MSEQTDPIEPEAAPAAPTTPAAAAASTTPAPAASATPVARRSVTVPLLPLAIVGGIVVALLFFGGGVAIGYGVASHDGRPGDVQQYRGGGPGFGDGNGFAPRQNQGGQDRNGRPGDRATPAPNNG